MEVCYPISPMLHTSQGDRCLTGDERRLFLAAVANMYYDAYADFNGSCSLGIPDWDRLKSNKRLALLLSIC
jgi:hypothetical protein